MKNLDVNTRLVMNRRVIAHDIHCNFITIQLISANSANNLNTFCIPRINFPFSLPIAHGQSIVANSH